MIPSRLKLRNFMPYRGDQPAFSFAGIHTACISGDNGAGKSSLIDAMTWALWGKTRTSSDDDLISTGADETEVEFDFLSSGQVYRIIRKRTRAKKTTSSGQSSLDLLVSSNGGFKSIGGNTMLQTQAAIIGLLHMDYDTFINSAYLRQGNADEFSRQPPAKRKEVLASILKLDEYELLAEAARQKSRDCQAEKSLLDYAIQEIETEVQNREALRAESERSSREMNELNETISCSRAEYQELLQRKHALESQQEQMQRLQKDALDYQKQIDAWQNHIEKSRQKIAAYEDLIARRGDIEQGHAIFLEAKQTLDSMGQQLNLLNRLLGRKNQLEKALDEQRARLQNQAAAIRKNLENLEARASLLAQLEGRMPRAEAERRQLEERQRALATTEEKIKNLEARAGQLQAQTGQAEQNINEIDVKLESITQNQAVCPLCDRGLDEADRQHIRQKLHADRDHQQQLLASNRQKREAVTRQMEEEQGQLEQSKNCLQQDRLEFERKLSVLLHRIEDCRQAADSLETERSALKEIEDTLQNRAFARRQQQEVSDIDRQIEGIHYDEKAFERARIDAGKYEKYNQLQLQLAEAENQIDTEKGSLAASLQTLEETKDKWDKDRQTLDEISGQVKELPSVTRQAAEAEATLKQMEEQQTAAREKVYRLQARLDNLEQQAARLREKQARLKQVSEEETAYRSLVQAFGKKGIQGMLIEMAIPEIENEANRILGKMTDNRMALKIESQKLRKTGEVAETLDINISDEAGTRNYEMYSGGEAFRIDFALRIALAKLLANRSGAPLPTLIVDEGFGTQDNVGLERVKEAINSIQEDFEMILVITHIEELKNAFNTRIEVIKTPEGSTVQIS